MQQWFIVWCLLLGVACDVSDDSIAYRLTSLTDR